MIELNRDDKQYLAVEEFEEYELTYCMAYEMAIRNDEVIKTIASFYMNYINNDIYDCYVLSTDDFKKAYNDAQKLMEFFISPLNLYLNYHFFKPINEDISKFKEESNNEEESFLIERLNFILHTPFKEPSIFKEYIPLVKIIEEKIRKYYISFISHKISEDTKSFIIHHNSITPKYSRPLTPCFKDIKERNLKLNLALPTNELIDFIKKLKADYDREHSFFGTVEELKGNQFKGTEKRENILSNQIKLADMLYIYDCLKLGYSKAEIRTNVYIYYKNRGIKTRNLHIQTINSYQKIMIEYIDNFRYKELILGIKL